MYLKSIVVLLCLAFVNARGVPRRNRVFDSKLSNQDPGSKDYDHEAFMGKEGAREFEKLSPEESARRLSIIFDKIDIDSDGYLTEDELKDWIIKTRQRYVNKNTKREFESTDTNGDGVLEWSEYYGQIFGSLKDEDWEKEDNQHSYKRMLERDQVRWKSADENGDGKCDLEEFKAFLHPEEYERMQDVIVDDALKDMDKNSDGYLDIDEYMNDMYRPEDPNEDEPEWVPIEREQFQKYRDVDKDGRLSREEVKNWILPEDFNHALAETAHLFRQSDKNTDYKISKDEMIEHQHVFVGSQATDWGEMMNRHDEF